MSEPFALPSALTIYSALETRDALLAWVAERSHKSSHLELSASKVDEIDGAGLQLLAALTNAQQDWHLVDTSAVFTEACRTLGLGHWLDAHSVHRGRETTP